MLVLCIVLTAVSVVSAAESPSIKAGSWGIAINNVLEFFSSPSEKEANYNLIMSYTNNP